MGRKNSLAKNSIQMLCVMQHLDEQNLYERSKLLLSIYRNVCWTACDRAAMLREEAEYCYGRELEEGLLYLNDFAPTVEREKFEETVKSLFQTKWLVELVDSAMVKKAIFDRATEEVNKQLKRQMILYKRRIKELELQIELLEEENQRLKENR